MARNGRFAAEGMSDADATAMVERLRLRARAAEEAACLAGARGAPDVRPAPDEAAVRVQLELAGLMLTGGRFSEAEHFFYTLCQVERVHENRWLGGAYDRELQPIMRAMEKIEQDHGLEEGEYFAPEDAPADWLELDRQYEAVLSAKLEAVLAEFGLAEALELRRRDRARYDRLWETGRLAFGMDAGPEARLVNLIRVCELEAERSAAAEAYWAAVSMLARAAEACLILHCLRRPEAARDAAERVPAEHRPDPEDPFGWSLEQYAAVALAGGWLHNLPDERLVSAVVAWLGELPPEHPGELIAAGAQPWLGESEYRTSLDAYTALRSSLALAGRAVATGATLQ